MRRFRFLSDSIRATKSDMSDQTDNTERRIIEAQSSSLLIRDEREKSPIISEIVTSALTIAQGSEILLNDAESIFGSSLFSVGG